ncbi:MAG: hypothetical protein GY816_09980 [Cytophagales bacterium]|nr:hypothetical protein [Cytophagales bacterium]
MKAIEDQIKDNREQLDIETPPEDAWNEIRMGWKKEEKQPLNFQWWKVAAAVFFISTVGLIGYSISLNQEVEELASLGDISAEYRAIEAGYQVEISQLNSTLSIDELSKSDEYAWVMEEMRMLEEINKQYRADIGESADQELLVRALLDYYEKKIRLLKKLELEIKRQKNEETNTTDYSNI